MNLAKIQLSAEEMQLVEETQWLLTKNGITEKLHALFAHLAQRYQELAEANYTNQEWVRQYPKVSKGEKLGGLPYMVLDYPRIYEKEKVLALRTLFWWGHYFSTTLHLKGNLLELNKEKLVKAFPDLVQHDFRVRVSTREWNDEEEAAGSPTGVLANWTQQEWKQWLDGRSLCKLFRVHPLTLWNSASECLFQDGKTLLKIIS